MSELDDLRKAMEQDVYNSEEFKKLTEKFGDPKDKNNPLTWIPSQRKEKGLSIEERLSYLELDVELVQSTLDSVLVTVNKLRLDGLLDKLRVKGPEGAALADLLEGLRPGEAPSATTDNHSEKIASDTIVKTVDGDIRVDQIPGYRDDGSWQPSPDWIDANCPCQAHEEKRRNSNGPTGFYL